MGEFVQRIDSGGRLLIPSQIRRELGIMPGSEVIVAREGGGLRVYTRDQALRSLQSFARALARPGSSVVEELIRDRRKAARRELRD